MISENKSGLRALVYFTLSINPLFVIVSLRLADERFLDPAVKKYFKGKGNNPE